MKRRLFRILWGFVALIALGFAVYGMGLMMTYIKPEPGWSSMATWGIVLFFGGLAVSVAAAKLSDKFSGEDVNRKASSL